jgi:hypothetical protein
MRSIAIIALTCASVSFAANAAAQDAAITKDDRDALVSASNIFMGRYPIGTGSDPNILKMVTPTSGHVERTNANFRKAPDAPCMYQMFGETSTIAAQIDFHSLSDEYAIEPSGYGARLIVYGEGPAVCDQFDGLLRIDPNHRHCYDRYVSMPTGNTRLLLRYFRYIFSNVCAPRQLPVN